MDLAIGISLSVHLEHLAERWIGVSACTMAERFVLHRNVMIKHNQFHIILQHIHHFFQVIRIMQWKSQQDIVPVEL